MAGFSDLVIGGGEAHNAEDIYLRAGATWDIGWALNDAAGAAIDITTGYVVRCEIRPDYTITPLFTFATTAATGTTRQISGEVALLATAANTATLASTETVSGLYDVKITKTSTGEVVYISTGRWHILPEVTI